MPYFALIIMFYHVKIACYQCTRHMATRICVCACVCVCVRTRVRARMKLVG